MEPITLYTLLNQEVITIEAPPFQPMPEIIQWGARLFVRQADGRYVEGMWWIHPDPETFHKASYDSHILIELANVRTHLLAAMEKHAPLNSFHEGYAVIYEELCEYWDQVRAWPKSHDPAAMREELLHMAAMCLRTIIDRKL